MVLRQVNSFKTRFYFVWHLQTSIHPSSFGRWMEHTECCSISRHILSHKLLYTVTLYGQLRDASSPKWKKNVLSYKCWLIIPNDQSSCQLIKLHPPGAHTSVTEKLSLNGSSKLTSPSLTSTARKGAPARSPVARKDPSLALSESSDELVFEPGSQDEPMERCAPACLSLCKLNWWFCQR